ncbi:reticulon-like protein B21 [Senna tora]|uniref:Reticulon-like protein n=1 Tax=Senna tora TaxID=362788 RepID=A0A834SS46_9FABA|nr:reticulon-like protein B21 [Senna tora]
MDVRRRRGGGRSGSVAPGSVWESRMKSDEVRGGIKVFNGEESCDETTRFRRSSNGKRKTWKSESSEGFDKSQILGVKKNCDDGEKQQEFKGIGVVSSSDGIKKNPIHARKIRAEASLSVTRKLRSEGKTESDSIGTANPNVESSIQLKINNTDGICKDFGVCQEKKEDSSSSEYVSDSNAVIDDEEVNDGDEERGIEIEIEKEKEKESFDVKEINVSESEVVMEPENKKAVIVNEPPQQKKVLNIQRRFQQNQRPVSNPLTVKQSSSSPIKRHSTIYQNFRKANSSIPKAEECHRFPQTHNKLQSLVDLIMWRDVSRSSFVFGIGTFIIVSSSYANDINVSSISVMSYLGLLYLAVIFLYRSFICRGVVDLDGTNYVLGEEEAIWALKLILPYLNEFLLKLRAFFSGDPGTTMKLAILLFVLARCSNSITIWKMAKFGFFGVFTVPKIYSLYSAQLTAYANFWVGRLRDAWDSCSHKKAVALGIFGLVWNLASVVARIWAVFVLFVALRYYQQKQYLGKDEVVGCDEATWHGPVGVGGQRQGGGGGPSFKNESNKVKKGF